MSTEFKLDKWGSEILAGLDKTTVDGYAEALLVAMAQCRDPRGLLIRVSFGSPVGDIFIAKQIAALMLRKEPSSDQ